MSMTALQRMKNENNVVGFKTGTFAEAFRLYMEDVKENSMNTYKNYMAYFKDFFMFAFGKDIDQITWDDAVRLEYADIKLYRTYLSKTKKNSNNTVNQKMLALKALWNELKLYDERIKPEIMDLEPLKVKEIEGSEALTEKEVELLLEFAKQQEYKPMMQYMFFKIAVLTALRKDALLNLQWSNVRRKTDRETGKEFYCINVYDKTERRVIPLRDDVYEELKTLKDPIYSIGMRVNDDRIFKISEEKLVETLKKFCEQYGIQRKITLHSLRKTSADLAYLIVDGDIKKVQVQTGHKSVQVLVNRYQGTRNSLSSYPGLMMLDDSLDINKLEKYSKEEIIKAIEKCGKGVLREILCKLEDAQP